MPYSITTPDGIRLTNIPDHVPKNSPLLEQLASEERQTRVARATPQPKPSAAPEPAYDPTEGMSGTDKVLANVGAAMADLYTGGKQLYTGMFGSDEDKKAMQAEVDEKRRMDEHLANKTTGGKALQIAGNVLPTLVIPAGGFARGVGAVARQMPYFAGRALPRALMGQGVGGAVLDSSLAGAAAGGLQTTGQGESRLANTAIGAGVGSLFPLALAGARGLYRRVGGGAGGEARAASQLADAGVSPQQARDMQQQIQRQAQLEREMRLRGETGAPPRDLTSYPPEAAAAVQPHTGSGIPLSTAAHVGNEDLARLEAGNRAKNGANWYQFDQDQAAAVNRSFMRGTREADEIAARRAQRGQNWDANWQQAASQVDPHAFQGEVAQLRQNLEQALRSPQAVNSDVRRAIQEMQNALDQAGEHLSPEHLQVMRRELSGKMNPMSQSPLKQVSREEPAIGSMTTELDRILNDSTGGGWDPVRQGYAADSRSLEAARAAGKVRTRFYEPETGRVRGVSSDIAGDVPKITENALGGAMDLARGPTGGTQLSPQAQAELNATLAALRRQGIVQGVKRSATAGGGSNTASDVFAAQAGDQLMDAAAHAAGPAGGVVRGVTKFATNLVNARRDRELAQALQNPQQMVQLLDRVIRSGEPLTGFEQQVLNTLRGGSAGLGAAGAQAF